MRPLRRKLLRELRRNRGQFAAIILIVLLGTALFGGSFDAWRNLKASYDQVFVELGLADFTLSGLTEAAAAEVEASDGVARVEARDTADTGIRVGGRLLAGRLVAYPNDPPPALDRLRLVRGELPTNTSEVAVEKHLADALSLAPGSTLDVALAAGWREVTVSAVVVSAEYLWPAPSRQQILVPPDEWGVLYGLPTLVSQAPAVTHQLLVGYAAGADRSATDGALHGLAARLGATDAVSRAELASNAALQEDINGFGELSLMFPMLFLGTAGLAVYVMLGRLVRAQRAEIGVLLALGVRRRSVLTHFLGYGLVAALAGAIAGALLGLLLGGVVTTLYTTELGIPTNVVQVYPETPVIGIGFALAVGLIAALVPALRAARVSPGEAMRALSVGVGQISLAERLLPPLRRMPGRWRLVVRGLGRNRLRSGATIVGIVLAVTLVLVSWGMLDTVQVLVDRQYVQIERQSLEVTTVEPVNADMLDALAGIDGVEAAEPVAQLQVGLSTSAGSYGTLLVGFEPGTVMHTFLSPSGAAQDLPSSGLLVADSLRGRLSVNEADNVAVGSSAGSRNASVAGFVHEPLGSFAYASLPYLRQLLGDAYVADHTRTVMLRVPAASVAAVDQVVGRLPGVAAVVRSDSIKVLLDQYMGLFYAFVGVMLVLGAILGFALIYATISANVAERAVELANLRASGMSAGQIGRLITAENMLLATIAVVPGLIVGYVGAAEFMSAFNSDLFAFDLIVRPLSFVAAGAAAFLAVALSLVPTLRAVAAVDLGKVVRERVT